MIDGHVVVLLSLNSSSLCLVSPIENNPNDLRFSYFITFSSKDSFEKMEVSPYFIENSTVTAQPLPIRLTDATLEEFQDSPITLSSVCNRSITIGEGQSNESNFPCNRKSVPYNPSYLEMCWGHAMFLLLPSLIISVLIYAFPLTSFPGGDNPSCIGMEVVYSL